MIVISLWVLIHLIVVIKGNNMKRIYGENKHDDPSVESMSKEDKLSLIKDILQSSFDRVGEGLEDCIAEDAKKKHEAFLRGEWIVESKFGDDNRSVEISAVIKGTHGHISWGWDDDIMKVTVLSIHSIYQNRPVSDAIIKQAQWEAQEICNERNAVSNTK